MLLSVYLRSEQGRVSMSVSLEVLTTSAVAWALWLCPRAPLPSLCSSYRLLPGPWRAGSAPRLAHPAPSVRSAPALARQVRAAPTLLAGDRKVVLCTPEAAAVLRARHKTCSHADASERRLGPGAAGATRVLTPARLPLRARPAGVRTRRGPGRGWGGGMSRRTRW